MVSKRELFEIIIQGRNQSYVSKNSEYNPYIASNNYDWGFEKEISRFVYIDEYRSYNPYSGVEHVYAKNENTLIWVCDYLGYVIENSPVSESETYKFLKLGRSMHLNNCNGDLITDYAYECNSMVYRQVMKEKDKTVFEKVDIYYKNTLIAQHFAAGAYKIIF